MEHGAFAARDRRGTRRRRVAGNGDRPVPSGARRLRRIALILGTLALIPVLFSYVHAMSEPSNSSVGVRSVEWLRDNGAAGIVARVESIYYGLTAPARGGPTLHTLPRVGVNGTSTPTATRAQRSSTATRAGSASPGSVAPAYRPARVAPIIQPALAGEGVWRATRPGLEANPPMLLTTLRNEPEYPRVAAGLAWIDTKRTRLALLPGRQEPSVSLPRGSMDVPRAGRARLLATFNSGFKLRDSRGGFALNGHTYATMQSGEGTLVGYADGHVDVIDWRFGSQAPAAISFARQNLPLIVDEGHANPNLANGSEWGATVGNAILVWRSGIGVDRYGNLIYAAGNDQTVRSLADTLIHAGAVRAMELDINSYWVSFITYGGAGALNPANLLPSMNRSASRYLEPDDRDFFALYSR